MSSTFRGFTKRELLLTGQPIGLERNVKDVDEEDEKENAN